MTGGQYRESPKKLNLIVYFIYLEYIQKNDLTCDGAMTDPKGTAPSNRMPRYWSD